MTWLRSTVSKPSGIEPPLLCGCCEKRRVKYRVFMPAISFQAVSKSYAARQSGGSLLAVDRVSLDIEQGEFFGLLGPNGAGKTTLISMLAGLSRPTAGHVRVLGHDVQQDFAAARRLVGMVPQELVFDPFSACARRCTFSPGISVSRTTGLGLMNSCTVWV